ncbi:VP3 [Sulfolobus ellipsoid virus 1]|uniref:VP3 n=1 Tax=Sulfolobus ellipsoid virus 1 TaxID=2056194 RepID=A0A2H4RBN8_9VIRU|nr:VP3 [Sulfolobus ellipsoid virus 1]ATY46499.1 VP3 [Sulfolobus ellipsoid virus 1]
MTVVGQSGGWIASNSGQITPNCSVNPASSPCSSTVNKMTYGIPSGQCGELFTSVPTLYYSSCGSTPMTWVVTNPQNQSFAFQVLVSSSDPNFIVVIIYNPNGVNTADPNSLNLIASIVATFANVSQGYIKGIINPNELGTSVNQWINLTVENSNPDGNYQDAPIQCSKQTSTAGINYIVCQSNIQSMAPNSNYVVAVFDDNGNPVDYGMYAQVFVCNQPYSQLQLSNPATAIEGCYVYTEWSTQSGIIDIPIPSYITGGYFGANVYIEDNNDFDSVNAGFWVSISTSAPLYSYNVNDIYNALSKLVGSSQANTAKQSQSNQKSTSDPSTLKNPPTLSIPILAIQHTPLLITQNDRTIPINVGELAKGYVEMPIDIKTPVSVVTRIGSVGNISVLPINASGLLSTKSSYGYVGISNRPYTPLPVLLPHYSKGLSVPKISPSNVITKMPVANIRQGAISAPTQYSQSVTYQNNAGIPPISTSNYVVTTTSVNTKYNTGYTTGSLYITGPSVQSSGYLSYSPPSTSGFGGQTYILPQNGSIIINNSGQDIDVETTRQNFDDIVNNGVVTRPIGVVEQSQPVSSGSLTFTYSRPVSITMGADPTTVTISKRGNNVIFVNSGQKSVQLYASNGNPVSYNVNYPEVYVVHTKGLGASLTTAIIEGLKTNPASSAFLVLPFLLFLI